MTSSRLAVLGSPISHSQSPQLHLAAYDVLGLDWTYERIEVDEAGLARFVASCDETWRGLSVTMPLKNMAASLADRCDAASALTGSSNTLLFARDGEGLVGANTDVPALAKVMADAVPQGFMSATVIGGGATALSATVAARQAGAEAVDLFVRNPDKAQNIVDVGRHMGCLVSVRTLSDLDAEAVNGVTVCTLPGNVSLPKVSVSSTAVLIDVAYSPWPTQRAQQWLHAGALVRSGLHMLARQALLQVRIFVTGSQETALDNEAAVWKAMCHAVGLDA